MILSLCNYFPYHCLLQRGTLEVKINRKIFMNKNFFLSILGNEELVEINPNVIVQCNFCALFCY